MGRDSHFYLNDQEWGPWLPNTDDYTEHYSDYSWLEGHPDHIIVNAIDWYLRICSDQFYANRKKEIIEKTGYKVFPKALLRSQSGESITGEYEGFSTTRPQYAHYIGDAAQTVGAKIFYNCWFGEKVDI